MLAQLDPRRLLARCVRCGLRGTVLCPECQRFPLVGSRTPNGLPVLAMGPYGGHLADCVRRLKYHDETHLAFPLGTAFGELAAHARVELVGAALLPVPLHPLRLAERGYNQSALIGRHFAGRSGARLEASCLFRTEVRTAQALLSARERRSNLDGAFAARVARGESERLPVFLLDDVVTTGSTADSCATALRAVGRKVIGVLACAVAQSA
jgi:ComF family protein